MTKTSRSSPGPGSFAAPGADASASWEIDTKRLDEASRWLDRISKSWAERLDRLRRLVEGEG